MKKVVFISALSTLLITGCSSAEPTGGSMLTHVSTAHVEGDDVYIKNNGTYFVAKGQKETFESHEGDYMTVIQMSDGSYVIRDNEKDTVKTGEYDRAESQEKRQETLDKLAEEAKAEKEKEEQAKAEQIEFQRSKVVHEQSIEQQKVDLKAQKQEEQLKMQVEVMKAQIEKIRQEIDK